jgi:hypothetical protein
MPLCVFYSRYCGMLPSLEFFTNGSIGSAPLLLDQHGLGFRPEYTPHSLDEFGRPMQDLFSHVETSQYLLLQNQDDDAKQHAAPTSADWFRSTER